MSVTSQIRPVADFDIPVRDWQAAGLLKPSVIKPVIATIEQGLAIKKLGRLLEGDCKAVAEGLMTILKN